MKKSYLIASLAGVLASVIVLNAASFTSIANGNWSSPSTWTVIGTDADGIPDSDDDVFITSINTVTLSTSINDCQSLDINFGGALSTTTASLRIHGGNFTRNGVTTGTFSMFFFPPGGTISAIGTYNNAGNWTFQTGANYTIAAGTVISKQNYFYLQTGASVTNDGLVSLGGGSLSMSTGSSWTNGPGSTLLVARPFIGTASINSSAIGSTIGYNGNLVPTIRTANITYWTLRLLGSGTKALPSDIVLGGDLLIQTGSVLNAAGFNINIAGNWDNTANTNCLNLGTVTFDGTGPQTISRTTSDEVFNNLVFLNSGTVSLLQNIVVNGTSSLFSGTIDLAGFTYFQRGTLWQNEGAVLGSTGKVTFNGTSAQTIGGSFFTTFPDLEVSNTAGVSNAASNRIRGTMTLTSGAFDASANDFTFISDASGTARIGTVNTGGGSLTGTRWICQRFVGNTAPSSSTPYWSYFASPVLGSTVLDWDNEMFMSGVGGADGNACCPIFRSVRRYSGSVYTNVTSVSTALTNGSGFMVWLADNLGTFNGLVLDTRGTPAIGNVTTSVPTGFTIIGNPFMSQIQWSSLTRTNVQDYFYILDETISNYATWNGTTSVGTGKLNGSGGVINSTQAFLVQATAAGSVGIPETSKSTASTTFVRQALANNVLNIQLKRDDGQPLGAENVLAFNDASADGYENTDMPALMSPNEFAPYMRTLTQNGDELMFDNRNLSSSSQNIPLTIKPGLAGGYTLNFKNLDKFNTYSCLFLEDLQTGQLINLRSTSVVSFNSTNGEVEQRYIIHMDNEEANESGLSFCRYQQPDQLADNSNDFPVVIANDPEGINLTFAFEETTPVVVTLYNMTGQQVMSEQYNVSAERILLPLSQEAHGVYIVRIQQGDRQVTQKVNY